MTTLGAHVAVGAATVRAGTAYVTTHRRRTSTTFSYDAEYQGAGRGFDLDPHLPRLLGSTTTSGLPGSFRDSAPDRWGRNLLDKKHREWQLLTDQRLPSLTEACYLLGVSDATRQGALRFTRDPDPEFCSPRHDVPKLVELPGLLRAADAAADDDWAAIKDLLDAGSGSLGGARPKASVRGDDGHLWIAKFPHANDGWDVMAWEKVALDLAERSRIHTPRRRLERVGGRSVLLVRRFDRTEHGDRVPYISAMTLLAADDGDTRDYEDIAEAFPEVADCAGAALADMFRRVAFNVAFRNTDDHLRNHGFLRFGSGWTLSPVFDVNPTPDPGGGRVTGIAGDVDPASEAESLRGLVGPCRLALDAAREIVSEVVAATGTWRSVAAEHGISAREVDVFGQSIDGSLRSLTDAWL